MSLKHCKSHQLPIQKLVLVRLDTMLDLLANSPASVAAFAMRMWGVWRWGCGVWGVSGHAGRSLAWAWYLFPFPIASNPPTDSARLQQQQQQASAKWLCSLWAPEASPTWHVHNGSQGSREKVADHQALEHFPHTLGPVSATGPGPDQGRVCQEVLSCHWPAPQSGQPDSGWAAAVAASCHHWRRGQLWHWPMTMRKQQHGTLLGVTWLFTKNQGPRRRRGRDLVGLVLDRGWWYCWGILWTAAT